MDGYRGPGGRINSSTGGGDLVRCDDLYSGSRRCRHMDSGSRVADNTRPKESILLRASCRERRHKRQTSLYFNVECPPCNTLEWRSALRSLSPYCSFGPLASLFFDAPA